MHSIEYLQKRIDEEIAGLNFNLEPKELYDPIAYMLSIGGKRLRPALALLSCDVFGGDIEKAIFPALAIETFHNFTLIHDDIMDNAPIRRGHTTVYKNAIPMLPFFQVMRCLPKLMSFL
ncbi:MAG: polyprenyl synthetase family protein [Bacteroidales bacterium]